MSHPLIKPFIDKQKCLFLDGALGTELRERGFSLDHKLWSADMLTRNPDTIQDIHLGYLNAGAQCVISSSYQASIEGFVEHGLSEDQAAELLRKTVQLAKDARTDYLCNKAPETLKPLVAASIGPYGAYLADGQEYTGQYEISNKELRRFHAKRWEILEACQPDLMACETIPNMEEAQILKTLIERSKVPAWVSFSCKDGAHICDGTPIRDCATLFEDCDNLIAIGINCTAPEYVPELISHIKHRAPTLDLVVYPNSGEHYNAKQDSWSGAPQHEDFMRDAQQWYEAGARLIGGCCRIGPSDIAALVSRLNTH